MGVPPPIISINIVSINILNIKFKLNKSPTYRVRSSQTVIRRPYTTIDVSEEQLPITGPLQALAILFVLGFFLKNIPFLLKPASKDVDQKLEKNSAYECGVTPFALRHRGVGYESISHALFFIIMDLEILFAIPFAKSMDNDCLACVGLVFTAT